MTHFKTANMWRFTWKRQGHRTVLIQSVLTGLYYFRCVQGQWRPSAHMRRLQETVRQQARLAWKAL